MIDITRLAQINLTSFLGAKNIPLQVRIAFPPGCGGEAGQLILVPDQPAPGDILADFGPLTLCMDSGLQERVGPIKVDYLVKGHDSGFVIECERQLLDGEGCFGCADCV